MGGQLKAGDTVGIYVSYKLDEAAGADAPVNADIKGFKEFTRLAFQQVLVTSVQQAPAEAGSGAATDGPALPSGSVYVTLARNDADAAEIVFAAEFGKIWLSKESADSKDTATGPVTVGKASRSAALWSSPPPQDFQRKVNAWPGQRRPARFSPGAPTLGNPGWTPGTL